MRRPMQEHRVYVNSSTGWVQHGKVRSSPERAAWVAGLLARRLGWETAATETSPPARPARPGAPLAEVARVSRSTIRDIELRRFAPNIETAGSIGSSDASDASVADLASFALEAQLRDFIASNLGQIVIRGNRLHLYTDPLGREGKEYPTAVGPIDILAVDDSGNFAVIELKLERGPDRALGQLTRYMGWVKPNVAAKREVTGVVVARSIDDRLRLATSVDGLPPTPALRSTIWRIQRKTSRSGLITASPKGTSGTFQVLNQRSGHPARVAVLRKSFWRSDFQRMAREGIEPPTRGFSGREADRRGAKRPRTEPQNPR
jgi:hypothetical protein